MAAKKKSVGNQTRPAKKGSAQIATGSKDPRTGRGGRRHEWDKKRLTAARERLNLVKLDGTPDEIKKAQEEVNKHLLATRVSRERRDAENKRAANKAGAGTGGAGTKAGGAGTKTGGAGAGEAEEAGLSLPFGPPPGSSKPKAKAKAKAKAKPSSWTRIKDAIASFFGKS